MSKYNVAIQIAPEKLQTIELKMDAGKMCAKQFASINGVDFSEGENGKGIIGFQVVVCATELPKVFIEYHKFLIKQEVADALGLEKFER